MEESSALTRITFFRSYWDAEQQMETRRDRLSFLEGLLFYAFEGEIPQMTPAAYLLFTVIKPHIDISKKRSAAGKTARNSSPAMPENSGFSRDFAQTGCGNNKNKNKNENENKEWRIHYD